MYVVQQLNLDYGGNVLSNDNDCPRTVALDQEIFGMSLTLILALLLSTDRISRSLRRRKAHHSGGSPK